MFLSKSKKIVVSAFLLIMLVSCTGTSNKVDQQVLATAWQACNSATGSATGSPTGSKFAGEILLVWNLHPKMEYFKSRLPKFEEYNGLLLSSAPLYILGNYDETQHYHSSDTDKVFSYDFEGAGAILCRFVKYTDIETCNYERDIYIIRTVADIKAKIISWPDKKVIAETQSVAQPNGCPALLNPKTVDGDHKVELGSIDLWKWINQYKK